MTIPLVPSEGGGPLLAYSLQLQPDPLRAGGPARLTLVASNALGEGVTCRSVQLSLPAGTDATDLIAGGAAIANTPADGWTAASDGGVVTFTAPHGSVVISGAGLPFEIATTANDQPGTAILTLTETASSEDDPSERRSGTFAVSKFPADFELGDLSAVPPDRLDVAHGQPAHLSWAAIGSGVSCILEYEPSDDGATVSQNVPNLPPGGSFATQAVTRSGSVTFTLVASVIVLGQDNPLRFQRQLSVSVRTLSLEINVEPPAVGVQGLARLTWNAPNADHCMLDDGTSLASSGTRYFLLARSRTFTVTAHGSGGQAIERQAQIAVDPSIVATEAGVTYTADKGANGSEAYLAFPPPSSHGMGFPHVVAPGAGGRGGDATLSHSLPPLDTTSRPARVLPVTVTGGAGGYGGRGLNEVGPARGGDGGSAHLDLSWDPDATTPAQFIIDVKGGAGGGGSSQGASGSASATIAGQALVLPGAG